jgi:hypothetical protein
MTSGKNLFKLESQFILALRFAQAANAISKFVEYHASH